MIEYRNECVGCETCMPYCTKRSVAQGKCDDCKDETNELYYGDDGYQYCRVCVLHHLERVVVE